ncbi:MAG: dethiobiotin synthase, partial [Pseudohongiellaceae bacterium]
MAGKHQTYFITGTDTGVGKTWFSCALLEAASNAGFRCAAIKPLAAGARATEQGLRNDDALALQQSMSVKLPYEQVNPVCFEPAIAPHIAAARAGKTMTVNRLAGFCRGLMMQKADLTLVEGAGGWYVPVNGREYLSCLPAQLNMPVILVVAMRLGCLNHALLTAQAIQADRVSLAGWVANQVDPGMVCYRENLETLQAMMPAPMLAELPYAGNRSGAIRLERFLPMG